MSLGGHARRPSPRRHRPKVWDSALPPRPNAVAARDLRSERGTPQPDGERRPRASVIQALLDLEERGFSRACQRGSQRPPVEPLRQVGADDGDARVLGRLGPACRPPLPERRQRILGRTARHARNGWSRRAADSRRSVRQKAPPLSGYCRALLICLPRSGRHLVLPLTVGISSLRLEVDRRHPLGWRNTLGFDLAGKRQPRYPQSLSQPDRYASKRR
jgi:hypothetical protein